MTIAEVQKFILYFLIIFHIGCLFKLSDGKFFQLMTTYELVHKHDSSNNHHHEKDHESETSNEEHGSSEHRHEYTVNTQIQYLKADSFSLENQSLFPIKYLVFQKILLPHPFLGGIFRPPIFS